MRILGFTAESSFSATSKDYSAALKPAAVDGVIPQFCFINEGGTTTCCECYYGYCHRIRRAVSQ